MYTTSNVAISSVKKNCSYDLWSKACIRSLIILSAIRHSRTMQLNSSNKLKHSRLCTVVYGCVRLHTVAYGCLELPRMVT